MLLFKVVNGVVVFQVFSLRDPSWSGFFVYFDFSSSYF